MTSPGRPIAAALPLADSFSFGAVHQRLAGPDALTFLHVDVRAARQLLAYQGWPTKLEHDAVGSLDLIVGIPQQFQGIAEHLALLPRVCVRHDPVLRARNRSRVCACRRLLD